MTKIRIHLDFLTYLPFPFLPSFFFQFCQRNWLFIWDWLPEDDSLGFCFLVTIFCVAFAFQGFSRVWARGLPISFCTWKVLFLFLWLPSLPGEASCRLYHSSAEKQVFFLSSSRPPLFDFQHLYIDVLRCCCLAICNPSESVVWYLPSYFENSFPLSFQILTFPICPSTPSLLGLQSHTG